MHHLNQMARARLHRATQLECSASQNEPTFDGLVTLQMLERYRNSTEASFQRAERFAPARL